MNTKLILSVFLFLACGDNGSGFETENLTEFKTTDVNPTEINSICGNDILEPGEECDTTSSFCSNCSIERYIFINSSQSFSAFDIGNTNLDKYCTDTLHDIFTEDRPFTAKAWISFMGKDIRDNIYNSNGRYLDLAHNVIAYSFEDLTDGTINFPLIYDQNTSENLDIDIWTGTRSDGTYADNCNNWASGIEEFGRVGKTNVLTSAWTDTEEFVTECSSRKFIYCIEDEYLK